VNARQRVQPGAQRRAEQFAPDELRAIPWGTPAK
jgi:hypothetical protein